MFLYFELYTITQTLKCCYFFFRAKESSRKLSLTNTLNIQNQGYLSICQPKTEVQTMVYQNTEDAALYNKKHPFSLKRRRHLIFF